MTDSPDVDDSLPPGERLCDLPVRWQIEIVALRVAVAMEISWDRLRAIKSAAHSRSEP